MTAEVVNWLLLTSLLLTGLIGLVLVLRRPVSRYLGAKVAYALWALPLLGLLAPAFSVWLPVASPVVEWMVLPTLTVSAQTAAAHAVWAWDDWAIFVLTCAWVAGGVMCAVRLLMDAVRSHRLMTLAVREGERANTNTWMSPQVPYPLTVGWWYPRVLLPTGLAERLNARQGELVLAHEQCHARRRDNLAILSARLLGCVFWFHPLVLLAWRYFRIDQELACDAHVLAGADAATRRDYGHALLAMAAGEAAGRDPILRLQAGWTHPMRERIMMIKHHQRSMPKTLLGAALVVGMALSTGSVAIAASQKALVPAPPKPAALTLSAAPAPADSVPPAAATMSLAPRVGDVGAPPVPPKPASAATIESPSSPTPAPAPAKAPEAAPAPVGTIKPVAIERAFPRYPLQAVEQRIEGLVTAEFTVLPDGRVTDIDVIDSQPSGVFDEEAVAALSKWRFKPAEIDGGPKSYRGVQTIEFRL